MTRSLETKLAFLRGVYGNALETTGLDRRWVKHWESEQRIRIRCADGKERSGCVEISRGPEPHFVLKKNPAASGGYRLGRERVVAVQRGRSYIPTGKRKSA